MCTMTVLALDAGTVTLAVGGKITKDALPQIDRFVASHRRGMRVSIDLSEVTLLDHAAARFFDRLLRGGVELVNCPRYIGPWISSQIAHEPEN